MAQCQYLMPVPFCFWPFARPGCARHRCLASLALAGCLRQAVSLRSAIGLHSRLGDDARLERVGRHDGLAPDERLEQVVEPVPVHGGLEGHAAARPTADRRGEGLRRGVFNAPAFNHLPAAVERAEDGGAVDSLRSPLRGSLGLSVSPRSAVIVNADEDRPGLGVGRCCHTLRTHTLDSISLRGRRRPPIKHSSAFANFHVV